MRDNDYITKKYFEEAFDRKFDERFDIKMRPYMDEFKRHIGALNESFRHDLKAMTEQFVTRQEVRDIVHEEINGALKPIHTKLDMYTAETRSHGKRITKIEHAIQH